MTVQTPNLPTLNARPSWCNLRGGLDRSACVELRLSEVRQLAGCSTFYAAPRVPRLPGSKRRRPAPRSRRAHETRPLPDERAAPNGRGRISTGTFTITAIHLHALHAARPARFLAGDMRTSRAHVMRADHGAAGEPTGDRPRFRTRVTRAQPVAWPPERGLGPNPNRAPGLKITGLHESWSQPLRLEKWLYPTRKLPVYYLVCPGALGDRAPGDSPGAKCPPLSTRPPAREHPSTGRCPQRCLKLMMVLCTPAEARDARLAQLWIRMMDGHPNTRRLLREDRQLGSIHSELVARYGLLFEPRVLLCPRCLGVRYGNNPETVRQGWRQRNGRPRVMTPGEVEAGIDHMESFMAQMRELRESVSAIRALEAAMRDGERGGAVMTRGDR